jgi:hypothetical protein
MSGEVRPTLFETHARGNVALWSGLTDTFHRVEVSVDGVGALRGQIAPVKLTGERVGEVLRGVLI